MAHSFKSLSASPCIFFPAYKSTKSVNICFQFSKAIYENDIL